MYTKHSWINVTLWVNCAENTAEKSLPRKLATLIMVQSKPCVIFYTCSIQTEVKSDPLVNRIISVHLNRLLQLPNDSSFSITAGFLLLRQM